MLFPKTPFRTATLLALTTAATTSTGGAARTLYTRSVPHETGFEALHIGKAPQEATGFEALRAGRYSDAVRALRRQALDGNAAALSGWVTALGETGDHGGAVQAAERGVERGVVGARALLGATLMQVGRIAEARAALAAGARQPGAAGAAARVELGVLEYRYGDRRAARDIFDGFIDYYNSARGLSATELTAVGRALIHLSRWNYEYAHDALRALDEAIAAAPLDHAARLAIAELFLERYDAREAAAAFQDVLAENPAHPGALLGLARVARLEGGGIAAEAISAALATNPNLAGARTLLARLRLLEGNRNQALEEAEHVLTVNAADLEALGTKAAILRLAGDDSGFRAVMEKIRSLTAFPHRTAHRSLRTKRRPPQVRGCAGVRPRGRRGRPRELDRLGPHGAEPGPSGPGRAGPEEPGDGVRGRPLQPLVQEHPRPAGHLHRVPRRRDAALPARAARVRGRPAGPVHGTRRRARLPGDVGALRIRARRTHPGGGVPAPRRLLGADGGAGGGRRTGRQLRARAGHGFAGGARPGRLQLGLDALARDRALVPYRGLEQRGAAVVLRGARRA